VKTFKQYYLNEAYYQMIDEDLDKIVNYIYDKYKKMIIENKDENIFDTEWKYENDKINTTDSPKYNKPRLVKIYPEKIYYGKNNILFLLYLDDKDNININIFRLDKNARNFYINGSGGNGQISIELFVISHDYFIKHEKEIKVSIEDVLVHEFTHAFDFVSLYDYFNSKEVKKLVSKDKDSYNSFLLKLYRSTIETNALIHQLIYAYKRLQKENYPNLKNISLFELADKTINSKIINFVIVSSPRLQKYYIHRLNREGIPISKIGTSKYSFKELKDIYDKFKNDIPSIDRQFKIIKRTLNKLKYRDNKNIMI
jgi:hypothetical protein